MGRLRISVNFSDLLQWDVKQFFAITVKSKYIVEKLGKHLSPETEKFEIRTLGEKLVGILGVSNKQGMFDAETTKACNISQKYHRVDNDWLAYNPYRVNVGSIGLKTIAQKGEYISPAYVVFSCKRTILPEYIYRLAKTQQFNKLIRNSTTGTVRQTLSFEKLSEIEAPIPPIAQQRKILDEYNRLKEESKQYNSLVNEKEATIGNYITETLGFTSVGETGKSYGNFLKLYKLSDFCRWDIWTGKEQIASAKYPVVKFGSLLLKEPFYGANEKAIKKHGDVRYIRITDINEDGSLGNEFVTVANIDRKYLLCDNDFLIARSGNTVGKTFLYDNSVGKAIFAGYLIKFCLNTEKVLPKYLLYYTKSPIFKRWIASNQRISGQPNINGQEYKTADIILPPLNVQKRIVEKIDSLRKEIADNSRKSQLLSLEADEYFESAVFE